MTSRQPSLPPNEFPQPLRVLDAEIIKERALARMGFLKQPAICQPKFGTIYSLLNALCDTDYGINANLMLD